MALGIFLGGLSLISLILDTTSDNWHPHARSTYRVDMSFGYGSRAFATTPNDLYRTLAGGAGNIKTATGVVLSRQWVSSQGRSDSPVLLSVLYVAPNVEKVLDFGLTEENLKALDDGAILFTQSAMERNLELSSARAVNIAGTAFSVQPPIPDPRTNSYFQYDAIASISRAPRNGVIRGAPVGAHTFVVLGREALSLAKLELSQALSRSLHMSADADLVPLRSLRIMPARAGEGQIAQTGRNKDIGAALAVLIIALAGTGTSTGLLIRATLQEQMKTLGLLAVTGRSRVDLVKLIVREVGAAAAVAAVLGMVLTAVFGQAALQALGKTVSVGALLVPAVLCLAIVSAACFLLMLPVVISVVRGTIPNLLASEPAKLNRLVSFSIVAAMLQAGLCFGATFFAFTVYAQTGHVKSEERLRDVWHIPIPLGADPERVRQVIQGSDLVSDTAITGWTPFREQRQEMSLAIASAYGAQAPSVGVRLAQEDILQFLGYPLIAGSYLDDRQTWGPGICEGVANTELVALLGAGSPQDTVGRYFPLNTEWGKKMCRIVGVVDQVTLESVRRPTPPEFYVVDPRAKQAVLAKTRPGTEFQQIVALVRSAKLPSPVKPLSIQQLEAESYVDERRLLGALIAAVGALLAMMSVAFLSAAHLSLRNRWAEVGVRRAYGDRCASLAIRIIAPLGAAVAAGGIVALPIAVGVCAWWFRSMSGVVEMAALALPAAIVAMTIPLVLAAVWSARQISKSSPTELLTAT